MNCTAFALFSTKKETRAPLLRASIPMLPEPLNKSRKAQPGIYGFIMLKRVSFIRSTVGLVSKPGADFKFNLLAFPAITLMLNYFKLPLPEEQPLQLLVLLLLQPEQLLQLPVLLLLQPERSLLLPVLLLLPEAHPELNRHQSLFCSG